MLREMIEYLIEGAVKKNGYVLFVESSYKSKERQTYISLIFLTSIYNSKEPTRKTSLKNES